MSRPHKLQIKMLGNVAPTIYAGGKLGMEIEIICGEQQQRAIAVDMICRMGADAAALWARKEFPEWFESEEKKS